MQPTDRPSVLNVYVSHAGESYAVCSDSWTASWEKTLFNPFNGVWLNRIDPCSPILIKGPLGTSVARNSFRPTCKNYLEYRILDR